MRATASSFGVHAALIDLDGTLLDTAADIAVAVNAMLVEHGRPPLPEALVRSYIGRGTANLVRRCFGPETAPEGALECFRRHYQQSNGRFARPFPGVVEGLARLREKGLRLACVTNKPEIFVTPLLKLMKLDGWFDYVVCGDTLARCKPDPLPLTHTCEHFGIAPQEALMIGDSMNDVEAARAAGCPVVCVPYGYAEGRQMRAEDCDAIVPTIEAAAWLVAPARPS